MSYILQADDNDNDDNGDTKAVAIPRISLKTAVLKML